MFNSQSKSLRKGYLQTRTAINELLFSLSLSLKYEHKLYLLTLLLIVFFPLKGMIAFLVWISFDLDISIKTGQAYMYGVMIFLVLSVLKKNVMPNTLSDQIFIITFMLGASLSIVTLDSRLFGYAFLLFLLPILLYWVKDVDDKNILFLFNIFSSFTIIYICAESLVTNYDVLGFKSEDWLIEYQSVFTGSKQAYVIDERRFGSLFRTGGYLGNFLAMPVLVLFSFLFYYATYRIRRSVTSFIFTVLGFFALIYTSSATAIISGLLAIITYELVFSNKNTLLYLLVGVISLYLVYNIDKVYVITRFINNINSESYMNSYIGFSAPITDILVHLLFGAWKSAIDGVPSHIDHINIVFIFGLIPTYFLGKKWYLALMAAKSNRALHPYAIIMIGLFFTLFHQHMGLTFYCMPILTICLVRLESHYKAYRLADPIRIRM